MCGGGGGGGRLVKELRTEELKTRSVKSERLSGKI